MKQTLTLVFILCAIISHAQSKHQWENYKDPLTITKANAHTIDRFENTPASVVTYFYAFKIRMDDKWKRVVKSLK